MSEHMLLRPVTAGTIWRCSPLCSCQASWRARPAWQYGRTTCGRQPGRRQDLGRGSQVLQTACKGAIRAGTQGAVGVSQQLRLTAHERRSAEAPLSFVPVSSKISTTPHTESRTALAVEETIQHSSLRGALLFPAALAGMASAARLVIAFTAQRAPQPCGSHTLEDPILHSPRWPRGPCIGIS